MEEVEYADRDGSSVRRLSRSEFSVIPPGDGGETLEVKLVSYDNVEV